MLLWMWFTGVSCSRFWEWSHPSKASIFSWILWTKGVTLLRVNRCPPAYLGLWQSFWLVTTSSFHRGYCFSVLPENRAKLLLKCLLVSVIPTICKCFSLMNLRLVLLSYRRVFSWKFGPCFCCSLSCSVLLAIFNFLKWY